MKRFCPYRTAFLFGTPVIAIALTIYYVSTQPFNWAIWLLFAVFYSVNQISITGGYHRLFSHRAYQAKDWLKWGYALFGAGALQNSILTWSRDHRVHHRFVDTHQDPYNINRGFWYAHIGWMILKEDHTVDSTPYGRDLETDPVVAFQHKYYLPIAIFMCFGLPTLAGWAVGSTLGGIAILGFLRLVLCHHFTFFINSWCHMWGQQKYTEKNTAKDSFIMAVATFGEGYHNFHHLFANDYRNGIRWYHWDPTKWSIRFMALIGGASQLMRTPQHKILQAQMEMDEKRLKNSWARDWQQSFQEQLDNLRTKINATQARADQLRAEYKALRESYTREQWRKAHAEFKAAKRQWRQYNTWLLRAAGNHLVLLKN